MVIWLTQTNCPRGLCMTPQSRPTTVITVESQKLGNPISPAVMLFWAVYSILLLYKSELYAVSTTALI